MTHSRIVLIAHAPLASAVKACAVHIFGESAAQVLAIDVQPDEDVSSWHAQAAQLLQGTQGTQGAQGPVLLLTDVFGATPFNIARDWAAWCCESRVEARVISGLNVPMLLRAITYSQEPLEQWVQKALSGGLQGIAALPPEACA